MQEGKTSLHSPTVFLLIALKIIISSKVAILTSSASLLDIRVKTMAIKVVKFCFDIYEVVGKITLICKNKSKKVLR